MAKNRKLKETNKDPPNILPFFFFLARFNFIEEKSLPHTQKTCLAG